MHVYTHGCEAHQKCVIACARMHVRAHVRTRMCACMRVRTCIAQPSVCASNTGGLISRETKKGRMYRLVLSCSVAPCPTRCSAMLCHTVTSASSSTVRCVSHLGNSRRTGALGLHPHKKLLSYSSRDATLIIMKYMRTAGKGGTYTGFDWP